MSDTPLTENHLNYQVKISGTYGATPEFARCLERENIKMKKQVEDLVWLARRAAGSSSLRHFIPIRDDATEILERHGFNKEATE